MFGDEIAHAVDAIAGQGDHGVFFGAIDPDKPVLSVHLIDEIEEEVLIFAELECDLGKRGHGVDFVPLHQAASSAICSI